MTSTLIVTHWVLITLSLLSFVPNQHWIFRVADTIKLQLFCLQMLICTISCFYINGSVHLLILLIGQILLLIYHAFILMRYTKFWRVNRQEKSKNSSKQIKFISCNVYQFNNKYEQFIELVRNEQPDIILTVESNKDWEKALSTIEGQYPYSEKIPLENTYGMHLYSKFEPIKVATHYFVADDIPSIEATFETPDGYKFVFFGVHPPPPSPTEEATSKERDGDLLSIAKRVRGSKLPVLVTGDFNTVAWAKASLLFKKTSKLIDARIGRGILSTFHAKYWIFRIPLDLVFHSPEIFIDELTILPDINSDHFPVGCTFHINLLNTTQEDRVDDLETGEMEEVNEIIMEGKAENSDNRETVAT